jgi:hypothetical protein
MNQFSKTLISCEKSSLSDNVTILFTDAYLKKATAKEFCPIKTLKNTCIKKLLSRSGINAPVQIFLI